MIPVLVVTPLLIALCVFIHYEGLSAITNYRRREKIFHRRWMIVLILGALVTHTVEISVFGCGYALLTQFESAGILVGADGFRSKDYFYLSAVAYTSLGFGDITPSGLIRFTVVVETLTGLVLIAWTASVVFVEMQSSWNREPSESESIE